MATPFIAGIVAKMKSAYPYLTAIELEMLLKIHAKDLYEEGFDAKSGFGKIDLSNFSIDHKGLFFKKMK